MYLMKVGFLCYSIAYMLQFLADCGLKDITDSKFEDWNDITEGKISSEILILGSSRACTNYDPAIIENHLDKSTFNLGFNAASFNLQKLKYEVYMSHNEAPEIIIQNVDISHFNTSEYLPDLPQFIPFMSDRSLMKTFSVFDSSLLWKHWVPLFKYNKNKLFFLSGIQSVLGSKKVLYSSYDGFTPVNKKYVRDSHNLEKLKTVDVDSFNFPNEFGLALQDINSQANHSKVFLVWAPIYEERLEISKTIIDVYKNKLRAFADLNTNIHFIDYSDSSFSYQRDYFYDSFHMNKTGATKFSMELTKNISKLIE